MNIFITGSGGFLGGAAVKHLKSKNYNVLALHRSTPFHSADKVFYANLASTEQTKKLISVLASKPIGVIIHFAAVTPFSRRNPNFKNDLRMARNVVNICKVLKIPKVIFVSGWVVYDPSNQIPFSENSPLRPNTEYGKSKLRIERYFRRNFRHTSLINLRLSSVYGPGQITPGLIPNLAQSVLKKQPMIIHAIESRRDYLYIDDFLKTLECIIKLKATEHIDLNVGSGKSYSVLDVARTFQEIMYHKYGASDIDIIIKEPIVEAVPLDNILDISEAQRLFKISPCIDLKRGLMLYIKWLKKR